RRRRHLVPLVRKRELGVRRVWAHAAALRQHQRSANRRVGSQVPLAAGPPSGRPSRAQRTGSLASAGLGPAPALAGTGAAEVQPHAPTRGRPRLTYMPEIVDASKRTIADW